MLKGKRFEEKLKKSYRKWRKRKGGGFDFENIKILEKFSNTAKEKQRTLT